VRSWKKPTSVVGYKSDYFRRHSLYDMKEPASKPKQGMAKRVSSTVSTFR
jgi:hypothetical protein